MLSVKNENFIVNKFETFGKYFEHLGEYLVKIITNYIK